MKTIKQIADELGVSKTAVRNKIENLGLRSSLQKNGNQFAIDENQEMLIKSCFCEKEPQTANRKPVSEETETFRLLSDMVSVLKEQLSEKDRLISSLQNSLNLTTEALVSAQESIKAAQLLHANAEQKMKLVEQKEEEQIKETENIHRKCWWKFWE